MKLVSLVTYTHIHLISFIYLSLAHQSNNNDHSKSHYHIDKMSDQNRKFLTNQLKANLLRELGIKQEPKRPNKKVQVPRAMIEDYLKLRDSMRDAVPDDNDFYGKLDMDDVSDTIKQTIRGKRHTSGGTNHRKEKDRRCNRRSMVINFEEVGWKGWIIAPASYNAYYCGGDCTFPMSDQQNATNHAIIQSIYHSVGRIVPKSCCAPVKLGTMAMLFQLDDKVNLKLYKDMIVESCGCL